MTERTEQQTLNRSEVFGALYDAGMLALVHGLLLSLVAASGVGIHIGETNHVSYEEVLSLVEVMASFVEQRTERPVVIDSRDWEQCRGRGPCLDEVRARTRASDVVVVRVIAGPLTLHVSSERFYADATRTSSASLSKNEETEWRGKLEKMVAILFPESPQSPKSPQSGGGGIAPPPPSIAEQTTAEEEPSIVPWIVLGASGAVAAVGIGFGVSNLYAQKGLEGEITTAEQRADLEARMRSHGIAAAVLFSTAGIGAVTALLLYVFD